MNEDHEVIKVKWIKGTKSYVGICLKTNEIFMITDLLIAVLTIQDIYLDKKSCEEGKRCLNLSCKFNKTTYENFIGIYNKGKNTKIGRDTWNKLRSKHKL